MATRRFSRFSYTEKTLEEETLEQQADALLSQAPADRERPAYTERQLSRHGIRVDLKRLALTSPSPEQPLRDELKFLASVSLIAPEQRRCFQLWIDGWSQREIADACRVSQQFV